VSKDPLVYVGHILESIEDIESFLADVTEADFMSSSEKQSAVTWKLVVIGESVANLPDDFKGQYPAIPWAQIKAARNILVHEYFRLDVQEVWNIAVDDLPKLKSQLKPLIA
jgi:uncharacterized protein with HEPN domain